MRLLIDSTVLSNFAYTDSIDVLVDTIGDPLLEDLETGAITTGEVESELEDGYEEGYDFLDNALKHLVPNDDVPPSEDHPIHVDYTFTKLPHTLSHEVFEQLDSGEATLLYTSIQYGEDLYESSLIENNAPVPVATDDQDACELAEEYDIPTLGSLSLLAESVKSGQISTDTADDWLESWIEGNGYWSPIDSIDEVL
ncbi:hypothetical protein [Haloarcula amylolytica]|uniref:hypothetical protein n=1 Tax=Haloarcula amylolytica TaxID=396317 RepID=UPI003C74D35F